MKRPPIIVWLLIVAATLLSAKTRAEYLQGITTFPVTNILTLSKSQFFVVAGSAGYIADKTLQHLSLHLGDREVASQDAIGQTVRFSFHIAPEELGQFALVLKGRFTDGSDAERPIATITVVENPLTLLQPIGGESITLGQSLPTAADSGGSSLRAVKVRAYRLPERNTMPIETMATEWGTGAELSGIWRPISSGVFALYATAWNDTTGQWDATPPVIVTVLPVGFPLVRFGQDWEPSSAVSALGEPVTFPPIGFLSRGRVEYQWMLNGEDIPGATDPSLSFTPRSARDFGEVRLRVMNFAGSTVLYPLSTIVWRNWQAPPDFGGTILFDSAAVIDGPVATLEGTPLNNTFLAELFVGRTLFDLERVGPSIFFQNGQFHGGVIRVPKIDPGEEVLVQIHAYRPPSALEPYPFAYSKLFRLRAGADAQTAATLQGLEPFSLIPTTDGYYFFEGRITNGREVIPRGSSTTLRATGSGRYTGSGVTVTDVLCYWFRNGKLLPTEGKDLVLNNVQPEDAGEYRAFLIDRDHIGRVLTLPFHIAVTHDGISTQFFHGLKGPMLDAVVSGPVGATKQISSSTDLQNWTLWKTIQLTHPAVLVNDVIESTSPRLFLRLD